MCGIVGYMGKKEAAPILLEGLRRLEYRGYDSSGLAVLRNSTACCIKKQGKVVELEKSLRTQDCAGTMGIAHTRWATHGEPSEINAHPHFDEKKEFFLVHNGIIENYRALRKELEAKGHVFHTQTDTETLVYLIADLYKDNLEEAVLDALNRVKGTYGILVFTTKEPEKIVGARNGSPLILGIGDGEYLFASDATALIRHTKQVVYIDDGEVVVVTPNDYHIITIDRKEVNKSLEELDWDLAEAEKQGHEHFMLKEIIEEPDAVSNSIRGRTNADEGLAHLGGLASIVDRAGDITDINIVACGTAYYAGMVGEYMLEEFAGIPTDVDLASEYRYRKPILRPKTAVIAVSQSGETADTLAAIREAKRKGALALGITNVVGSTIARETDAGVYNHVGPEIGVASTKAFVSQLTVLTLFTLFFGRMRSMSVSAGQRIVRELDTLPRKINTILDQKELIHEMAKQYVKYKNFMYMGRKYSYPIALEGALKLKEISYVHAEGYSCGEMKHGPIALIDDAFPTVFIAPKDSVYEKTMSSIEEVKARKGKVIAVTTEGNTELEHIADNVIYIPQTLEMLSPILSVVPLHLFAYYMAVELGNNVDKPRNLAKSVTVE